MSICRSPLSLAALLCVGLVFNSSCVRGSGYDTPTLTIQEGLSREARVTYAALLLDQSLRHDSLSGVVEAADTFLELAPLPQPLTEAAAWLLINKQITEARTLLEKAIVHNPDDLSLHILLAETWIEEDNPLKAAALMEAYQRAHPESDQARQELGILLLKGRRYADAEKLFAALPEAQRSPYVRYCHARALVMLHRPQDAARELARAVKERPDFTEGWSELARAHELAGQPDKARAIYRRLMDSAPENVDYRLRAIGLELIANRPDKALTLTRGGPDGQGFLLAAASIFMEDKRFREAETVLETLSMNAGTDSIPDEVWLLRAGVAFEGHKDARQALEWLDRITPGSRSLERAYRYRVQIHYASGNDPGVQETLRQARAIFPDEREFMLMEAHFHIERANLEHAHSLLQAMLARFPEDIEVLYTHAIVLAELNRTPEALDIMEQIIKLDQNYYQALNYVGYSLAVNAGNTPGKTQAEAARELTRSLELLRRAASLAPDKAYILDSLAWALYRTGNHKEALETIRKAVKLPNSTEWEIWDHYGDIANAAGHVDEARRAWKKALAIDPERNELLKKKLERQ